VAKKPIHQPWHPTPYSNAEAYAIKALAAGTANAGQQKIAIDWILRAAGTYDVTFQPDSERATSYAEGKRAVGLQVVKLINIPVTLLKGPNDV
jgi:hypothetical protein